jgi:site-specific recombinase XerD
MILKMPMRERLLQAGNDITVIALWLGHEQVSTANIGELGIQMWRIWAGAP